MYVNNAGADVVVIAVEENWFTMGETHDTHHEDLVLMKTLDNIRSIKFSECLGLVQWILYWSWAVVFKSADWGSIMGWYCQNSNFQGAGSLWCKLVLHQSWYVCTLEFTLLLYSCKTFSGDFVPQAEYWICCLMVLFCGSMYVKLPWQGICWFFLFVHLVILTAVYIKDWIWCLIVSCFVVPCSWSFHGKEDLPAARNRRGCISKDLWWTEE